MLNHPNEQRPSAGSTPVLIPESESYRSPIQDRDYIISILPISEEEVLERSYTRKLLTALGTVLKLHHCPKELRKFAYLDLSRYLSQADSEKKWVELAKYVLSFPIARYLRDTEPRVPTTKKLLWFHKRFHGWFRKRLEKFSVKNTWFFSSWLQAKRACEPLSELQILNAFISHRKGMSRTDPVSENMKDKIFLPGNDENPNFVKLLDLVKKKLHRKYIHKMARVSRHACLEGSRAEGGQRGTLVRRALNFTNKKMTTEWKLFEQNKGSLALHFDFSMIMGGAYGGDLVSMYYHPNLCLKNGSPHLLPYEIKGVPIQWHLEHEFHKHSYHDLNGKLFDIPRAMASPVLEPLKIRMISKGESKLYYSMKSFQQCLHKILRKIPLFRLIGRPQSPTDLSDIVDPYTLVAMDEPCWLSADYSAATDGLSATIGSKIMSYITSSLPLEIQYLALRTLGLHGVSYPSQEMTYREYLDFCRENVGADSHLQVKHLPGFDYSADSEVRVTPLDVRMTNGQLMGSITSFNILCLANALVLDRFQTYVSRKRRWNYSFEDYLRCGLVNGDDLLTVVDGKSGYNAFEKIAKQIGFDMTPGKSYCHSTYANVNSAAFHFNLREQKKYLLQDHVSLEDNCCKVETRGLPPVVPIEVNYFNTGLYMENHKVQERVGGESQNKEILEFDPSRNEDLHDPARFYTADEVMSWKVFQELSEKYSTGVRKKFCEITEKEGCSIPDESHRPLWAIANRILAGCPVKYQNLVAHDLELRIKKYGESICLFQQTNRRWSYFFRNIFLPISIGGLGVVPPTTYHFRVTKKQRQLRSYLIEQVPQAGHQLPLPRREGKRLSPEELKVYDEFRPDDSVRVTRSYEKKLNSLAVFEENNEDEIDPIKIVYDYVPGRELTEFEIDEALRIFERPSARSKLIQSFLREVSDDFRWWRSIDRFSDRGKLLPSRPLVRGVLCH